MKFSEAKGHKVVSLATAETVGKVRGLLVDPVLRSVVAVRLKKKTDRGDILRWDNLTAFGVDAVTISDLAAVTELDADLEPLRGKRRRLRKKRVLTSDGDELGKVADVDFDPDTGALTNIILHEGPEIPAERLIGVGSYAVVVREQPDS